MFCYDLIIVQYENICFFTHILRGYFTGIVAAVRLPVASEQVLKGTDELANTKNKSQQNAHHVSMQWGVL